MEDIHFDYSKYPITAVKFYADKGDKKVFDILRKNKDIPNIENECILDFFVSDHLNIWIRITEMISENDCKSYQVLMKNSKRLMKKILSEAVAYFEANNIEYVKNYYYHEYVEGEINNGNRS